MRLQAAISLLAAVSVAAQDVTPRRRPDNGGMLAGPSLWAPPVADSLRHQAQGNASVVTNNPPGVVYGAELPAAAFFKPAFPVGGNVKGSIQATANPNGIGVKFRVQFAGLPGALAPSVSFPG